MSEMHRYKCYKEVSAFKVGVVVFESDGCVTLVPAEKDIDLKSAIVSKEWYEKHKPNGDSMVGGYYVLYEDGYTSWSPAEAFENGYTRIEVDDHGQVAQEVES